jgi:hypothetical protein
MLHKGLFQCPTHNQTLSALRLDPCLSAAWLAIPGLNGFFRACCMLPTGLFRRHCPQPGSERAALRPLSKRSLVSNPRIGWLFRAPCMLPTGLFRRHCPQPGSKRAALRPLSKRSLVSNPRIGWLFRAPCMLPTGLFRRHCPGRVDRTTGTRLACRPMPGALKFVRPPFVRSDEFPGCASAGSYVAGVDAMNLCLTILSTAPSQCTWHKG